MTTSVSVSTFVYLALMGAVYLHGLSRGGLYIGFTIQTLPPFSEIIVTRMKFVPIILEQISNATVLNVKYFSSGISYQAYFLYLLSEVMK